MFLVERKGQVASRSRAWPYLPECKVFSRVGIYSTVPPVDLLIERFGVQVSVQYAHVILNKV